ncbi:MAG: SpoIIE family protein phosphatase [Planctomycetota bacterium]
MGTGATTDDLTNRIAVLEAELRTLRSILDLAPLYVYAIDEDGIYRFANRAAAEDLGHTPESIVGRCWPDIAADPAQARGVMKLVPEKLRAGVPVVTKDVPLRLNRSGDAIVELYEAPFRDADGKQWLLGIARDRTSEVDLEQARLERARLDRDLSIAHDIQQSLLPARAPARDDLDVHGWSHPADDAGGDFFDWFTTAAGDTCVVLGDVTGHGIGPALVAATTRAYARATFSEPGCLGKQLAKLNELMASELPEAFFVTLAAARVPLGDPGAATYVSAGHGPTFFRPSPRFDAAGVRELDSHGPPLGILAGISFADPTPIPMIAGARLVLASDGLHERARADGTQLGTGPLASDVQCHSGNAASLLASLLNRVEVFADDHPRADDMTAVALLAR